jgi:hypothetical protein
VGVLIDRYDCPSCAASGVGLLSSIIVIKDQVLLLYRYKALEVCVCVCVCVRARARGGGGIRVTLVDRYDCPSCSAELDYHSVPLCE